jgi:hypothetical protein
MRKFILELLSQLELEEMPMIEAKAAILIAIEDIQHDRAGMKIFIDAKKADEIAK